MFKIIFLIIVLLIFLFIYSAKKKIDAFLDNMFPKNNNRVHNAGNNEEELIKCENCGTYIPKSQAVKKIRIGKKPLYFCSEKCKKEYKER